MSSSSPISEHRDRETGPRTLLSLLPFRLAKLTGLVTLFVALLVLGLPGCWEKSQQVDRSENSSPLKRNIENTEAVDLSGLAGDVNLVFSFDDPVVNAVATPPIIVILYKIKFCCDLVN